MCGRIFKFLSRFMDLQNDVLKLLFARKKYGISHRPKFLFLSTGVVYRLWFNYGADMRTSMQGVVWGVLKVIS